MNLENKGIHVAIEWPRGCRYWAWPRVRTLVSQLGLRPVDFDGCMLGVQSEKMGKPILKHWRIMTSAQCILNHFANLRCNKTHEHVKCEGADTELTGRYTVEFARAIHRAWRQEANLTPLPVAPSTAREQFGQPIVVDKHGQPFVVGKHVQPVVSMPVVLRQLLTAMSVPSIIS